MRLFTALDLPSDITVRLEHLLAELRPQALIKWSPLENLHITTKFIGHWPDDQLDDLDAALQTLRFRESIQIEIQGVGWFPTAEAPRVLWAGVRGGPPLMRLAADTNETLSGLAIPKEPNAFSPHVTLARIKSAAPLEALRSRVEEHSTTLFGRFRACNFYLFRSVHGANASVYERIRSYQFAPDPGMSIRQPL